MRIAQRTPWTNPWTWCAIALCVIYLRGLSIDVMEIDAAQYAAMSMELLQHGHWLQLHYHFADYLDKPPLLFWTAAIAMAGFGVHSWAYKLPSLLGAAAGILAVYRFARLYYTADTARIAAFILATSVGLLLICNDVRTDTLLLGCTACATWQAAEYLHRPATARGSIWHLLLAGVFVGLGMLAKGPIGLVAPGFAVVTHVVLRRDWRRLWSPRWLLVLVVAGLVLLPMCWGLYQQFDLHPERVVNGERGVSGLYFYFWQQSFGRITGTSNWRNSAGPFYFVHVYLWAFLPWTLLFVPALWHRLRTIVRQRARMPSADEAYSLGGFVVTFVALSLAHYKLPHYVFITLPWAALLTARWLTQPDLVRRGWRVAQFGVLAVIGLVLVALCTVVFPTRAVLPWLAVAVLAVAALGRFGGRRGGAGEVIALRTAFAGVAVGWMMNFHFYPALLRYQGSSMAAHAAVRAGIDPQRIAFFQHGGDAFDFYAQTTVPGLATPADVAAHATATGSFWVFTNAAGRALLRRTGVHYDDSLAFAHFPVARLTLRFLNARTRPGTLVPVYLLHIVAPDSLARRSPVTPP